MKIIPFNRSILVISFLLLVSTGFTQNLRNILIDDLTNTNCGHCPCMDTVLQQVILKHHPNTVIIAIHGSMSRYENNDFFPLIDSLHFESDGAAHVNRMGLPTEIDGISDTVDARYARMPQSPVKLEIMSKNYDPASGQLTVVVKSTALLQGMQGQYRINAAILESNLIGYQQHFPECPGGDAYNHKFVLRALKFNPMGDNLVIGNWEQNTFITRTIILDVDEDWVASNCDVIVFVDKAQGPLNNSEIQQAITQGITRPLGVEPVTSMPTAILNVFPNPVHGITSIHISIAEAGSVRSVLIDMNGKLVKTITDQHLASGLYNMEFDASEIPAGNYMIRMESNRQAYTTKIQIQ